MSVPSRYKNVLPCWFVGSVEAARFLGGQLFAPSRTHMCHSPPIARKDLARPLMFLATRYSLASMPRLFTSDDRKTLVVAGLLLILLAAVGGRVYSLTVLAQGWEPAIRDFEDQDKVHPPKPGCIVFAGSSSIRFWDTLVSDIKPLDVINRGFGGSEFSDLDQFANRIVVAYRPRAVVVYEGDNDLAEGSSKTPEMVAGDFRKFVQTVHGALPDTWIYILAIKPSKLRWNQWPQMKAANKMMQDYAATQKNVQYIDIATSMFDANGNLPRDLFKADGLHPTAKLYAMWTAIIKPILLQRFGPSTNTSRLFFSVPPRLQGVDFGSTDFSLWVSN
jgi:lysophospholipase L1-like esterase